MKLDGKVILVTGGAHRVGRAIAEELHGAGATVAIHYSTSRDEAAALHAALEHSFLVPADLFDREAPSALISNVLKQAGKIDALINSAADYARAPLDELSDDKWESMLALNLSAPMRLTRAAVGAGATNIVNMVDVAASQPWPNYLAYSTSKAALLHLSRCLALELAPRVRVNCVAPGTVLFPDDWSYERRARQIARIPLARSGTPTDVARAVRYLLEEDYLTGVCIPVDGGAGLR